MTYYENQTHLVTESNSHPDLFVFKNKRNGLLFFQHCSQKWIEERYTITTRPYRRRRKECAIR